MVRLLYEGDGISPPRPRGSASRQRSLRAVQGCVRFVAPYMFRDLLVDSSKVLLCYSLCRGFRFLGSGRVPRCLESVRFFHGMLAQGPADGRRLALMASSSFCRSSVARCCSKVFPRYVVARGSWVLGPMCLLGSGPPCVGHLVVFGPVPCRFVSRSFQFWVLLGVSSGDNGAVMRESHKLR